MGESSDPFANDFSMLDYYGIETLDIWSAYDSFSQGAWDPFWPMFYDSSSTSTAADSNFGLSFSSSATMGSGLGIIQSGLVDTSTIIIDPSFFIDQSQWNLSDPP